MTYEGMIGGIKDGTEVGDGGTVLIGDGGTTFILPDKDD